MKLKIQKRLNKALVIVAAVFVVIFLLSLLRVYDQVGGLYLHPFSVSNLVKNIETEVSLADQVITDNMIIGGDSPKSINAVTKSIENISGMFTEIYRLYLGDKDDVDKAYAAFTVWQSGMIEASEALVAVEDGGVQRFVDLHNQNQSNVNNLHGELMVIYEYAISKGNYFYTKSVRSFVYSGVSLFIVAASLSLYFVFYNRRVVKRINRYNRHLKKTNNLIEHILGASPDPMVISDGRGKVVEVNLKACEVFGYSRMEFKGMVVEDLIPSRFSLGHDQKRRDFIESEGRRTKKQEKFFKARTKGGEEIDVSITLSSTVVDGLVYVISSLRDVTDEVAYRKKIFYQANYDALTKLPNRSLAEDRFDVMRANAQRSEAMLALIFIDLDDFKRVNDSLGHEVGDELLVAVAQRIKASIRKVDTVARLGGDEFIVLLGGVESSRSVEDKVVFILQELSREFVVGVRKLRVGACAGVTLFPENGDEYSDLLRKSDAAMYHAKALGGNRYCFFIDSISVDVSRRFNVELEMLNALKREEFFVTYQPQICFERNCVFGAEALIRWKSNKLGDVYPDEFIPIAENNGEIINIGRFVIEQAVMFMGNILQNRGGEDFKMSVNLSPRQLLDPELYDFVMETLDTYDVKPKNLVLEITEGVLLDHSSGAWDIIECFSVNGIHVSMDDFGTGYSSLSYLRKYPFKYIKLDRSFISDIVEVASSRELMVAAIQMAHALGIDVVAEGVETIEQFNVLATMRCDFAQGYLFSKALQKEEFIKYIMSGKVWPSLGVVGGRRGQ